VGTRSPFLQPTLFLEQKKLRKPLTILKLKNGQPIAGQDRTKM